MSDYERFDVAVPQAHVLVLEPGRAERHYWRDLWGYRELFTLFFMPFFTPSQTDPSHPRARVVARRGAISGRGDPMVSKTEPEVLRQPFADLPWPWDPAAREGVAGGPPQRPDGPVLEPRPASAAAPR